MFGKTAPPTEDTPGEGEAAGSSADEDHGEHTVEFEAVQGPDPGPEFEPGAPRD
jgi:hypothetical protein